MLDLLEDQAQEDKDDHHEDINTNQPALEKNKQRILSRKQRDTRGNTYVTVTPRRPALVLPDPRDDSDVMKGYQGPFESLFNLMGYETTRTFD